MDEKIRQIVQEELQKYATENQYGVNATPIHTHNGTDSVQIPLSGIIESISISSPKGTTAGVFDPNILNGQKVNNQYTSGRQNPQSIYTLPVNIIYGFGNGNQGAFGGGFAQPGTMVFFENSTLSGLWIYTINGWRGVNFPLSE